ncbi:MAG: hypothetical protein QF858_01875 [Candidatus Pacebacteria bacterium]|jgi:hypothetical protein|nr:hypothetical protein [Candidatus Paceibacterota bacterium]MDP6659541.1 hypothetical protein [Candidatus Paceibacterota bacterium]|tara:strand:- start:7369 stop:7515 length:147 start_codon:yes stop_codon:yes gene_type:complete
MRFFNKSSIKFITGFVVIIAASLVVAFFASSYDGEGTKKINSKTQTAN